jgi:hypothetical protein
MLEVFFCVKAWLVVDMMKVRILKIKEIFLSFEKSSFSRSRVYTSSNNVDHI